MNKVILHVMGMDSSKYGSLERYNVQLSKALTEHGFHAIFIYEEFPVDQHFTKDLTEAGGELIVCNSRKNKTKFCINLARIICKYRPYIVHAHFTKARFYALPIARILGTRRLFFTQHGEVGSLQEMKIWTKTWYKWAGKAAHVIGVSECIKKQYLSNWPGSLVDRVYLGVPEVTVDRQESRHQLNIHEDDIVIVSISNFNHIKGLDILCSAIAIINQQRVSDKRIHFFIVGQPEKDKTEISELASMLGIVDRLHLVGISNKANVYLAAADIYVQPSRNEGISLALMEAASAKLPLIGSNVGGIPEVIHNGINGILVEKENPEQLANSITQLINDYKLRSTFGQHSHDIWTQNFDVEKNINNILTLYSI